MTKKLVFLHGRAQQNKDSFALKKEWVTSFQAGLAKNGLELPISEADIRFPYYGDTLNQIVEGVDPSEAAKVIIRGPEDRHEREFISAIIEEIRLNQGISEVDVIEALNADVLEKGPQNWGWVQAILKVLDRNVPFASGASVALAAKDVYFYLTRESISKTIEKGINEALHPNEPTVFVAHSLGTVIAYNWFKKEGGDRNWNIPLFVTLGSPLGVTRIRQSLAPISYPACIQKWFNAYDERDVVALYPLKHPHFDLDPEIINKNDVKNFTENRHGISGYLSDPIVAKEIYEMLL